MFKRFIDIVASFFGLVLLSPFFICLSTLIWLKDFNSPLYIAPRVGKNKKVFNMIKLRTMIKNADRTGVDSSASDDVRITSVGRIIRKFKLDEFAQLINVLKGDMSLVGPRPNVLRETQLYTSEEQGLLTVKPGITDFASIVFSDEGEILTGQADPDVAYNQLIRPWKSRLGLFYIEHQTVWLDMKIMFYTFISVFNRPLALALVSRELDHSVAPKELVEIARREKHLVPLPPPGSDKIVLSRGVG